MKCQLLRDIYPFAVDIKSGDEVDDNSVSSRVVKGLRRGGDVFEQVVFSLDGKNLTGARHVNALLS